MNENKTIIGTKEAAELVNCSTKTIQNRINKGRMSATLDEQGNYQIDMSELIRVFPDVQKRIVPNINEDSSRTVLELQIEHLKEIVREKNKQIEILLKQLDTNSAEKTLILETLSSNQKLLEYQSEKKIVENKKKGLLQRFRWHQV